ADDAAVFVSVQDSGKGMPPEVLTKIFDPFFTTKPVGQGTGLGLSISFKIIQDHGGSIRVASEPGRGTRFLISLPRPQASQLKE
ncbi:ATP-binding protein, partial [Pseudomonas sp. MOB-449]|nr:ATP-binding protein [Pseudomonas sp. MOB-449]